MEVHVVENKNEREFDEYEEGDMIYNLSENHVLYVREYGYQPTTYYPYCDSCGVDMCFDSNQKDFYCPKCSDDV